MSRQLRSVIACWMIALGVVSSAFAADTLPKVVDSRLKIELFAENPQIATPTGIDIDPQGRIWAIESNTHFPPEGYQGHPSDRLLVMRDGNGDGRADDITVFADGLVHAMSIAIRPMWFPLPAKQQAEGQPPASSLSVYVATRREIMLLHDDDGDLKADRRERLVHLETAGDYPHNGLAGIAFDGMGSMFFGFGENLGADYKLTGADGTTLSGGAEGGNLYRCRLDGTQLKHWATGFWNPHASCIDALGRMFSVDNDPDSRPPCRLLHIIPGGDYGYRFRNGRKGLHPFTAWNGEIPGTLPMVAGTGEAPSGIVAYEADNFPGDYRGNLLVGSWGDHRIDRFQLRGKGSSFTSLAEPIVVGNEEFRPVGLAVAPDGSLCFTDWVSREYKLHGRGRIWRLSAIAPRETPVVLLESLAQASTIDLYGSLNSPVAPVRRMAAHLLGRSDDGLQLLVTQIPDRGQSSRSRLEAFWAAVNLATQPQPPTKLLLVLRSLAAARSLGGSSLNSTPGTDDVVAAELWLSADQSLPHNPVIDNLLRLIPQRGFDSRGSWMTPRPESIARLAASINDPDFTERDLARRPATETNRFSGLQHLSDPFIFSLTVDHLAHVTAAEQFRKWWDAWQTPEDETNRPQFTGGQFQGTQFNAIARQSRVAREEQMRYARAALVLAARRRFPRDIDLLKMFLSNNESLVRRLAAQWVAEFELKELRPEVEAILKDESLDSDLFLSTLAALEMLDGISPVDFDKTPASQYVLPLVLKDSPPTVRKLALRLVSPADPALTPQFFMQLLSSPNADLRLEAIRTLQLSPLPAAPELLQFVARDPQQPVPNQAEAVAGLALATKSAAIDSPVRTLLDKLVLGANSTLRTEALRSLRGTSLTKPSPAIPQLAEQLKSGRVEIAPSAVTDLMEQLRFAWGEAQPPLSLHSESIERPQDLSGWYNLAGVSVPSDADVFDPAGRRARFSNTSPPASDATAGRRTFFHINSAGCAKCHTIDGRGGKIGPDLTNIARTMDRNKLAQSILQPSREMSPQFVAWTFQLKSGLVLTGLILSEESEKLKIGTSDGKVHDLALNDIEVRTPQSVSLMPEKLIDQLTQQEFLDLLAFLETLK